MKKLWPGKRRGIRPTERGFLPDKRNGENPGGRLHDRTRACIGVMGAPTRGLRYQYYGTICGSIHQMPTNSYFRLCRTGSHLIFPQTLICHPQQTALPKFNKNSTPLRKVQLFYQTIQNSKTLKVIVPQDFTKFYKTIKNARF